MQIFVSALSASLTACVITTSGILIISRYEDHARQYSIYFMAFAAGILISVPLMHIIPKSFHMAGKGSGQFVLIGFIGLFLVNYFLNSHGKESSNQEHALGFLSIIGIGLHSLIDGFIYSVTFSTDIFTGILSAMGTVLHEFPEGIIVFVILKRSGFTRKKSVIYAFLTAGATTPVGTLVSFPLVHSLTQPVLSILLAASAGALLYLGASHLLPAMERKSSPRSLAAFGGGIAVTAAIIAFKQH